jgi:type IV pilus assembly protein PilO
MMKLSSREKVLCSILAILILLLGYYKLLYVPQRAKIDNLKVEKATYEDKVNKLNVLVAAMPQKESDIKVISTKIKDKTSKLYPDIVQENIIRELDKLMNDSAIYGSIGFSEIFLEPVQTIEKTTEKAEENRLQDLKNQYDNIGKESSKSEDILENKDKNTSSDSSKSSSKSGKNSLSVKQLKVNLSFKGSYNNVVDFVKNLENYSKDIAMISINLSQSAENQISGTGVLEFFAIPKLTDEDKDYLNWDLQNQYGKDNIFDGSMNINPPKTVEDVNNTGKPKYDFVMSVKPQNSDFPAIMLGKSNDKDRKTYVYADSNKVENIEIVLEKDKDKYYYKYKTSKDSYPIKFNNEKIEFEPSSTEMYLNILSSKRISGEDNLGANVKLINKTDKKIIVAVEGEDASSPRVKIEGEGGNIEIKQGP